MPPWSLAARLTAWYAATAFLLVTGAATVQYQTLAISLSDEHDRLLRERLALGNAAPAGVSLRYAAEVAPVAPHTTSDDPGHDARWARAAAVRPAASEPLNLLVRDLDGACRPLTRSAPGGDFADDRLPPPACDSTGTPRHQAEPHFRTRVDPAGRLWRIATIRLAPDNRGAVTAGSDPTSPDASPPGALAPSGAPAPALSTPGTSTPAVWREAMLNWSDHEGVLRMYRTRLGSVLVVTLLLAGALGHALARRGLRPLAALAARVERIDATALDQRLASPDAPAEIRVLVRSFDVMLGRIEGAFRSLTDYAGHLAHEFRTPIHVLRQQTDVALAHNRTPAEYREVLASSLDELDRLSRMVDDVLLLARTEDPRALLALDRFPVAAELDAVADYFEPSATEAQIVLQVQAEPQLELLADRLLVRRALVNLVSNALRHTRAGGTIWLAAYRTRPGRAPADGARTNIARAVGADGHADGRADGHADGRVASRGGPGAPAGDEPTRGARDHGITVEVRDSGEGIAPEHLAHVFDRYYRAPTARATGAGSGLGLSIVSGIVALHGGTVALSSVPDQGTRVSLSFPECTTPPA